MPSPFNGIAEGRIVGEIHGQRTVNVFHFGTNSAVDDGSTLDDILLQLAQALLACARETLLPAVSSDWKILFCDAKRIAPTPGDPIVATALPDDVGELGPTSVSFCSSLMNIRTGGGGRRGRGRKFLPPPGEANITTSDIDPGTLLLLAAFAACLAEKFMGDAPETPWELGIFSRVTLAGNLANYNTAFRVATSLNPVATCAVLGSRKKGRGA